MTAVWREEISAPLSPEVGVAVVTSQVHLIEATAGGVTSQSHLIEVTESGATSQNHLIEVAVGGAKVVAQVKTLRM